MEAVYDTLDAMAESTEVFIGFNALTVKDVNLVFSLLPHPAGRKTNAAQYYFDKDNKACPLAVFPRMLEYPTAVYQQIIAHEMFHCVQDWSFPQTSPYRGAHDWWLEGTASYFSNVVYPEVNYEHGYLDPFDQFCRR